eukprot:453070-Hanusia_phi.AAC.2
MSEKSTKRDQNLLSPQSYTRKSTCSPPTPLSPRLYKTTMTGARSTTGPAGNSISPTGIARRRRDGRIFSVEKCTAAEW